MTLRPHQLIPIHECGEKLVPIPQDRFAFANPPPYMALGADYGGAGPWMLRTGVLAALEKAQDRLATLHPGWKILIFDAYRPNAVQSFMVEHEFKLVAAREGLDPNNLSPADRERLAPAVFRLWAKPSEDPATPPPHSTGAAMDITLVDEKGEEVFMGSPIDENSDRSNPDYFANATDEQGKLAHSNRELLHTIMKEQGFIRLRSEWWHFSLYDQIWAWRMNEANPGASHTAKYGRAILG